MQQQIAEIAKTPQARFEWWIQTTFHVLPTDPKFTNLTTEQMNLMYEQYKIDTAPSKATLVDKDYDKEEQKLERYEDPDFDEAWDNPNSGEDDSIIVPENLVEPESHRVDDANADDWEEVD